MKIELSPFQMAVLAQVFARDLDNLQEKIADAIAHPRAETPMGQDYIELVKARMEQQITLRSFVDVQISAADQMQIALKNKDTK